jgi:hypothetical protein
MNQALYAHMNNKRKMKKKNKKKIKKIKNLEQKIIKCMMASPGYLEAGSHFQPHNDGVHPYDIGNTVELPQ